MERGWTMYPPKKKKKRKKKIPIIGEEWPCMVIKVKLLGGQSQLTDYSKAPFSDVVSSLSSLMIRASVIKNLRVYNGP